MTHTESNNNNFKCFYHPNNSFLFFCKNCNNEPICLQCSINKDYHLGHSFELINDNNTLKIIKELTNNLNNNDDSNDQGNLEIKYKEFENDLINFENNLNSQLYNIKNQFLKYNQQLSNQEMKIVEKLFNQFNFNQKLIENLKLNINIEKELNEKLNSFKLNQQQEDIQEIIRKIQIYNLFLKSKEKYKTTTTIINFKSNLNNSNETTVPSKWFIDLINDEGYLTINNTTNLPIVYLIVGSTEYFKQDSSNVVIENSYFRTETTILGAEDYFTISIPSNEVQIRVAYHDKIKNQYVEILDRKIKRSHTFNILQRHLDSTQNHKYYNSLKDFEIVSIKQFNNPILIKKEIKE